MWTLGAINLSLRVCFYMPMHLLPWPLLKGKRNAAKWVAPHWWLLQEEKERNNRGCLPYNKAKHQAPSGADPNMHSVSLKYFKTRNSTFSNIAFAVSLIPAFRCLHSIHIRGQPWKGHVSCPGWHNFYWLQQWSNFQMCCMIIYCIRLLNVLLEECSISLVANCSSVTFTGGIHIYQGHLDA